MLTLWSILKAGVLVSNAACILHRGEGTHHCIITAFHNSIARTTHDAHLISARTERLLRPMGYAEIDQSQPATSVRCALARS